MIKSKLGNTTYCYENFITDADQSFILDWALDNKHRFKKNTTGEDKYLGRLHELGIDIPNTIKNLKLKIAELEGIEQIIDVPHNVDWIGIQGNGAQVFAHLDDNGDDDRYYTRRYNILISLPEEGGNPIYGGEVLDVKEKMIWRCDAGLVEHSSIPNVGNKPRVNLSFGFLMLKEPTKNV
jgi:hypothetical protein